MQEQGTEERDGGDVGGASDRGTQEAPVPTYLGGEATKVDLVEAASHERKEEAVSAAHGPRRDVCRVRHPSRAASGRPTSPYSHDTRGLRDAPKADEARDEQDPRKEGPLAPRDVRWPGSLAAGGGRRQGRPHVAAGSRLAQTLVGLMDLVRAHRRLGREGMRCARHCDAVWTRETRGRSRRARRLGESGGCGRGRGGVRAWGPGWTGALWWLGVRRRPAGAGSAPLGARPCRQRAAGPGRRRGEKTREGPGRVFHFSRPPSPSSPPSPPSSARFLPPITSHRTPAVVPPEHPATHR